MKGPKRFLTLTLVVLAAICLLVGPAFGAPAQNKDACYIGTQGWTLDWIAAPANTDAFVAEVEKVTDFNTVILELGGKVGNLGAFIADKNATDFTVWVANTANQTTIPDGSTLKLADGSTITIGEAQVPTTIEVTATDKDMDLNGDTTEQLTVVVKDEKGAVIANPTLSYAVTAGNAVEVNTTGLVTAKAVGNSTITVTCGGKTATISFTVVDTNPLTVDTVTAIDNSHVQVVFNKAVDKTTAETAGNYTVRKVVDPASWGPVAMSSAVLANDGKTVTLTLTSGKTFIDSPNGYLLNITGNVILAKDSTTVKLPETERVFSGVATADKKAPQILRAKYDSTNNKLALEFDKLVNQNDSQVVETKLTVKGSGTNESLALTEGAYATSGSTAVDKITLDVPTTIASYTTPLTLVVDAGAFVGANSVEMAAGSYAITLDAYPTVTAASYDENKNELTLTVNEALKATNGFTVTKLDVVVNGVSRTLTSASTATVNGTTVTIKVCAADAAVFEATTATSAKVTVNAGALVDVDSNSNVLKDVTLTYVEDTAAPQFVGASYNDLTKSFVLEFNENIDLSTIKSAGTVADGAVVLSGKQQDGTTSITAALLDSETVFNTSNSSKITIDVATSADVTELLNCRDLKLSIPANTIKDEAGNYLAAVSNVAVSYTDATRPTMSGVTSNSLRNVVITFDDDMSKSTVESVAAYTIKVKESGATVAIASVVLDSNGRDAIITTGADLTNTTYVVTVASTVTDTAGNAYKDPAVVSPPTNEFTGNRLTDTTAPAIKATNNYKYTDNGNYTLGAGDIIELYFDEPITVDFTKLTKADFAGTFTDLGDGTTYAMGSSANTLVITLGSGVNFAYGNSISVAATQDAIKDAAGNLATNTNSATIANPGTAPKLSKITYFDKDNSGTQSSADTIEVVFDRDIQINNTPTIADVFEDAREADFGTTSQALTVKTGTSNTLVATLAGTPSINFTNQYTGAVTTKVTDLYGTSMAALSTGIKVTKNVTTAPAIQSVTLVDTNSDGLVTSGETIKIRFTAPVAFSSFATDVAEFTMYYGASAITANNAKGDTATMDASDKSVVKVTVGGTSDWAGLNVKGASVYFNIDSTKGANGGAVVDSVKDAYLNAAVPSTNNVKVTVE